MKRANIIKYLWIVAIACGVIGILGEYNIVIIKFISKYNFELLLTGFILLIILRLFKK